MAKKVQLTKNGEDVYPITVPDSIAGLAQVAKTGSYNDLSDKPSIPLPSPPEVFLITRDVTTYAEIYAAVNAGKVCMMYDGDDVYTVTCCENGEPIHLYTYGKNGISGVEISPEDEWDWVDYYYTDFVIFHAKIGRSTLYQIFYAVNARMLVLGRTTEDAMGDELYSLVAISYGNQGYALFSRTDEDGLVYFAKVTKSGNQESWSYSERYIPTDLSELSSDSTHRTVTDTEKATWNGKYTKPAGGIPASDIASGVIPDVSGKYEKPSTGIPKTDLAQGVQDSLALADSALQSFTETDPTVPSWAKAQNPPTEIFWATYDTTTAAEITAAVGAGKAVMMNYSFRIYVLTNISSSEAYFFVALLNNVAYSIACNKITSAWVRYATYVLENTKNRRSSWQATPDDTHYPSEKLVKDSLDGKQPLIDSTHKLNYSLIDNTPTIPTVPTISTDIQTDKSSTTKTAAPSAVYNEVHPAIATTQPAGGFLPNIVYDLGTLSGNITFALATPADANVVNHYYWTFDTGSTAPTITWPAGITWMGGSAPTINASKHYEISVLNGIGVYMEV